jgi:uncharacterized membrane protein YuzA (DUF378 family)
MKIKGLLGWLAEILVLIGALNWGLVGAFGIDAVAKLFGVGTPAKIVYLIIGVAALYLLIFAVLFPTGGKKKQD